MRVGLVGAGVMGRPIARHLMATGATLTVHDRDAAAAAGVAGEGAQTAPDPAAVAAAADIVFLCLPDAAAVEAVAGAIAGSGARPLVADLSTIGPAASRAVAARLAAAGIDLVDAPMSGGAAGAVAGTLTALLSGPPEAVARLRPLVDAYASAVFVVGSLAGDAQAVKVLNNALSAIALAASGEALAVARAAGLDPAATVAAIGSGSGRNSAILEKIPRHVLTGGYDFGFPLRGTLKDTAAALALAAEVGVDMTIAEAARARYEAAAARFGGDADMTRVCDL